MVVEKKLRTWALCGAAAIAGISGQAMAAEPAEDGSQLQEVVVTAQRRAERLEDVPMTVTALTPQVVENRGIRNLQDLGQVVSGVQINYQGAFTYASVRGITANANGFGVENNVVLYIDGFYQPDSVALNADFGAIESLQVLKGPQGALYGRNATGGAILLTTLQPSKVFTGNIEAKYGTYNDRTLTGYVSGPITDRIRFSLSAYGRKTPGYYDLLNASGQKIGRAAQMYNVSTRAKIEADITEQLTATLGYNFVQYRDYRGSMYTPETYRSASLPPKVGRLYDPRTFATNHETSQVVIVKEGTLTLKYKTPIGVLSSYTGLAYRRGRNWFDFDGTWLDLSWNASSYDETSFQQGVDFSVDTVKNLDLIVGGTYWDDRLKTNTGSYASNRFTGRSFTTTGSRAWALFADATYHVTDRLVIGAGGRYTEEKRYTRLTALTAAGAFSSTPLGTRSVTFSNFSPRVSVRYEVADNSNVYATISRGFRSGGLQAVPTPQGNQVFPLQPEKITAYEVGYKTAGSTLRFDTSAFYYDYKNIQVGVTVPNPLFPALPINIFSNAARARVYGVEGQATWRPIDPLEISLGATWLHARYRDFAGATGTGFNAATNTNISGQVQNLSGYQMVRAPNYSATLAVSYEFRNVAGGELLAAANLKYTDSYVPNSYSLYGPLAGPVLAGQQRYRQGAYSLLNGSLTWTDPTDHYTVGVWANNITNVKYRLSRNGSAFGDYGVWGWPRQVGVRMGYKY